MTAMHDRMRLGALGLLLVGALALLAVGGGIGATMAHEGDAHPVHIHTGTCDELGEVVVPLGDIGAEGLVDGTPMAADEAMGPETAVAPDSSVTTVDLPLADIIAGGHAINAHESAEEIQNYIACGDIGGRMLGNRLLITLSELDESGYAGVAELEDNGDGTTTVSLFLIETAHEEGEGNAGGATPEAAAAGEDAAVTIADFSYNPDPIEVAVGGSVTWTNEDGSSHTATEDGGGFNSGRLGTGESFTQTFDEAGTYAYYCEYHANMTAEVVVE
ncbi:MAG: hypothetical protein AVDCRST_MAG73-2948 [uncultured Thermomicrobiales bacterium]|uniref:Blue (type 1) copper domain-containing protein n=1 Tax=uncultured Thermomicrobiales bacterium TaxID=1645740 RepID=A0A6J4UKZ4_9BACT|nr:MAG: hypothetical protein AVDCRST_MAG73-2948 [uncultured Thermomicrobiales bacterium]